MPDGPAPWRASGLVAYLRCGVAYQRRELNREGQPPTTALIRGAAVHRGIGAGLLQQSREGTPAPPDLVEDVAASEVARARVGGATLTAEEVAAGVARTFGSLTDQAVAYAGHYARAVAPAITPVAVERRITVTDLAPGLSVRGTLDVVTLDAAGELVRDSKTSERPPQGDAAERSQQLTLYAMLRGADTGRPVSRVALDYLVRSSRTGAVEHRHLPATRGPADFAAMRARLAAATRAITAGVFLPTNTENWWCSARWCEFHPTCPFALRGR